MKFPTAVTTSPQACPDVTTPVKKHQWRWLAATLWLAVAIVTTVPVHAGPRQLLLVRCLLLLR